MSDEITREPHYKLVVEITAVETKIKETVFNDLIGGVPESETKRSVYRLIKAGISNIKDRKVAREFELRLARAFRHWYRTVAAQLSLLAVNGKTTSTLNKYSQKSSEIFRLQMAPKVRNVMTTQRIGSVLISDYSEKTKAAYKRIAANLAGKSATRDISIRNIAEIEVRRAATADDIENLKSNGTKLVWVSSHANCSERCSVWQGRLYSLDGTNGQIDGHKFIPIETAINVPQFTKSGNMYINGLFGFNCRHHMIPYTAKSVAPVEYSAVEIEKERKIDLTQRRFENAIRKQKERGFILRKTNYKAALSAWEKARAMEQKYENFCRANNRVIYRERTRVMTEEVEALKI